MPGGVAGGPWLSFWTGMTAFVESCLETVQGSVVAAERQARHRPRARKLLKLLAGKRNILVTTHQHPDPDALGSAWGMVHLLQERLPGKPAVTLSIKGRIGGGVNEAFVRLSDFKLKDWDDATLGEYDAIVLLDTQPQFNFSPLPPGTMPLVVIDHHRGRGRKKPACPFCDIRTDVGATASIIFSYFMELEVPIKPDLAATLLFAVETDLAGAAGTPGELDNVALSSLTLLADTRKLYQMRYAALPQNYYVAYAQALNNAVFHETALMTHLDSVDSLEKPGVMGDFLLRFSAVHWVLVTAVHDGKLMLSLRSEDRARPASDVMRRVLHKLGEGGGHRTKAGGSVDVRELSATQIADLRKVLWKRFLRTLKIKYAKGQKLVP
jgi:nanoRNase/pAp phosphatase (c-di-AMP/oligoRNAs hydrolase)